MAETNKIVRWLKYSGTREKTLPSPNTHSHTHTHLFQSHIGSLTRGQSFLGTFSPCCFNWHLSKNTAFGAYDSGKEMLAGEKHLFEREGGGRGKYFHSMSLSYFLYFRKGKSEHIFHLIKQYISQNFVLGGCKTYVASFHNQYTQLPCWVPQIKK